MGAEIVPKGRGFNLIYQGHRLKKNRDINGTRHWRCTESGCRGKVKTRIGEGNFPEVISSTEHNHPADDELVFTTRIKADLCHLATEDLLKPLQKIYRDYKATLPMTDMLVPDYSSCHTIMWRARRKHFPPPPSSRDGVTFEGEWGQTHRGEEFIINHAEDQFTCGTDDNLCQLAQCKKILMDGTFKSAPKHYDQLYSIHGLSDEGHLHGLVYSCLADRTTEAYCDMFAAIKRRMATLGLEWNPETIVVDFEPAMLNALRVHFPNSNVQGCYFHHTQAIWRHVQQLGLTTVYRDVPAVKKHVRKLMALAFLPVVAVRPAFYQLKDDPIVEEHGLEELFAYFERTWLGTFKPILWNVHDKSLRTNNRLEGWHHRFNRYLGKHHPGVFEFILALKAEQSIVEQEIQQMRLGARPKPRRRKYRLLDDRLDRLTDSFKSGNVTVNEFLNAVRHIVHHY